MFGASEKGIKNEEEIEREVETKKKRQKRWNFIKCLANDLVACNENIECDTKIYEKWEKRKEKNDR